LQASELILNADASVYHLHLRNGELADRVITVGDPARAWAIAERFDIRESEKQHREFVTVTGRLSGQRLSVVATGIGTDNVDVVLNELALVKRIDLQRRVPFAEAEPLEIIRLGTSGALQEDLPLHSVLLSEGALSYDGLMPFYAHQFEAVKMDLPPLPDPYLVWGDALLRQGCTWPENRGLTLTAAGFYAPQGRSLLLPPARPDFLSRLKRFESHGLRLSNLEMETAGIYGLGHLLGIPTLSLSVLLANRITGAFSPDPARAVEAFLDRSLEWLLSF